MIYGSLSLSITEDPMKVLRIMYGEKPPLGYIYEGMDMAKEAIMTLYDGGMELSMGPI
jgi:hypothetical protein